MYLNNIIFDGTNNNNLSLDKAIKVFEYLHPLVYPKPIINKNRIKRNDPCFCGSNKKFKKCCMNKKENS